MGVLRWGVTRGLVTAAVLLAHGSAALGQVDQTVSPPATAVQGASANGQGGPDNGGRRSVMALRLPEGESITLDGRLDEPSWSRALPAADFIQIDPTNGQPATERTEVRIVFDR